MDKRLQNIVHGSRPALRAGVEALSLPMGELVGVVSEIEAGHAGVAVMHADAVEDYLRSAKVHFRGTDSSWDTFESDLRHLVEVPAAGRLRTLFATSFGLYTVEVQIHPGALS